MEERRTEQRRSGICGEGSEIDETVTLMTKESDDSKATRNDEKGKEKERTGDIWFCYLNACN